jgi:hypothetical protein
VSIWRVGSASCFVKLNSTRLETSRDDLSLVNPPANEPASMVVLATHQFHAIDLSQDTIHGNRRSYGFSQDCHAYR